MKKQQSTNALQISINAAELDHRRLIRIRLKSALIGAPNLSAKAEVHNVLRQHKPEHTITLPNFGTAFVEPS